MSLMGKRILITAGPTWVPIDSVRAITNIATGETGILLAERLQRLGAKVTLVLGPVENCFTNKKVKLISFKFFDELKDIITRELKAKKYDAVIHSAAVSDYKPKMNYKRKIRSGIKEWELKLIPTIKIINLIKKIDPLLFLTGFKFEPEATKKTLLNEAASFAKRTKAELTVANTVNKNQYCAYLINRQKVYGPVYNKNDTAARLAALIRSHLCKN